MTGAAVDSPPPAGLGVARPPATVAARLRFFIGLLSTVSLAVVGAALFLPHQSIWIDESTQLSGLTLSPLEVVRWLDGAHHHDFGVPGDRMPPLSYWLGWIWAHGFGLTETSLRWFGVACVAVAVGLAFRAAHRLFGLWPAIVAGAFLALSPNTCSTAVEIRTYPLFLLTAAGALDALASLVTAPERGAAAKGWLRLGAWLVAAIYSHFFGLILAGAVLTGLGLFFGRRGWKPLAALAAVVAVTGGSLVPFVRASVAISGGEEPNRVRQVAQLLFRLVAHPTMNAIPGAVAAVFLGAAILAGSALRRAVREVRVLGVLIVALVSGLTVTVAAAFVVRGFEAAKPTYSTWAFPFVALILAAPTAPAAGRRATLPLAGALLFIAGQLAGTLQLWRHGDHFAHGPHKEIAGLISDVGVQETAVVHVDSRDYGFVYFPLRYAYGPALPQFVVGADHPLGEPLDLASPAWSARLLPFRHLLLVRSKHQSGAEVGDQVRHGDRPFEADASLGLLLGDRHWRVQDHREFVSFVAADVTLLERAPTP
jgi:hypothetical protein